MCMHACVLMGIGVGWEQSSVGTLGLDSSIQKMLEHPGVTDTPFLDALWHSQCLSQTPRQ